VRFLILLLFCVSCSTKKLTPNDTRLDPNKRNWEEVYKKELISALENDDDQAFHFFWRYYLEERYKNKNKKLP
jgi:hypothetical protein